MTCRAFILALVVSLLPKLANAAAAPAELLLPDSTKGAVIIPSWDKLETSFDATQLGQLLQDPVMKPFYEDLKAQVYKKGTDRLEKLGVSLEELRAITGGEIAIALTQPKPNVASMILIVDVTGREEKALALREKIGKSLVAQGGQVQPARNGINIFRLARNQTDTKDRFAVNFLKKQTLVLTDDLTTADMLSAALDQQRPDSLKKLPAYQAINSKLAKAAGDLQPQIRWYLDPFGYAEASRIMNPPEAKPTGSPDLLKLLRNQGFAAIQGLGGFVNFSTGQQEMLHRTFIYAPGNTAPGRR
jgi:hypothetical protein